MICPFCGGEIPEESTECFICGEIIMKKVSEENLGKGITIIPNTEKKDDQPQTARITYNNYGTTGNYTTSESYDDTSYTSKKDNKTLKILIGVLAASIIFAVVMFAKLGFFDNKDGKYSVQNLDEIFNKLLVAEGQQAIDLEGVELETSITIDGSNCTFKAGVYYEGTVVGEEEFHGTVKFNGTRVTIDWEDRSGMGVAKYNSKDKSLTFNLDSDDAEFYGMDNLIFVKEDQ